MNTPGKRECHIWIKDYTSIVNER